MSRTRFFICAVILLAFVLGLVFYPSDRKRIRKIIHGCRVSIVTEDIDRLMEHISFNFRGPYGGSYLQLKKRAELVFDRFDDFDITADVMNINVEEKEAVADIKTSVIASEGNNRTYIIGDAGSHEDVKVHLEKSPYGWKVIRFEREYY